MKKLVYYAVVGGIVSALVQWLGGGMMLVFVSGLVVPPALLIAKIAFFDTRRGDAKARDELWARMSARNNDLSDRPSRTNPWR